MATEAKTRVEEIYAKLKADIIDGSLAPRARLSAPAIAAEFKVSSTVVREALTKLAAEGMAISSPQLGFSVISTSREDLKDLMRARTLIDSEAVRLSVEKADLDWKGKLLLAHYMLCHTPATDSDVRSPGAARFGAAHRDFHFALTSGCGSRRLMAMSKMLYDESEIYRRLLRHSSSSVAARNTEDHQGLLDAALGGDAATAVRLLTEHYRETIRELVESDLLD